MSLPVRVIDKLNDQVFNSIYSRSLVYNTCWEDPAVDRPALELGPQDNVLVITSAGCNALDYVIAGANSVHAVDMNPRQNALLELKMAGIRKLAFSDYFLIFGHGRHPYFGDIYRELLRDQIGDFSQLFWDRHIDWFQSSSVSGGLYFRGLSGYVAKAFRCYLHMKPDLRTNIENLLAAGSLDEQRRIYEDSIQQHLWSEFMNRVLSSQLTMNMLGVPHPQRKEVESQHAHGVAGFIRESIEYVFRQLPLAANYFWRVYLEGRYSPDCCPEYLRHENFERLKAGLVDRITVNTNSVTGFLQQTHGQFSRYVLLDHMDWMSSYKPTALAEEWQAIFSRATDDARVIFRSAHRWPSYLHRLSVPSEADGAFMLTDRLKFYPERADELQRLDRVHTYAGFHIADIRA